MYIVYLLAQLIKLEISFKSVPVLDNYVRSLSSEKMLLCTDQKILAPIPASAVRFAVENYSYVLFVGGPYTLLTTRQKWLSNCARVLIFGSPKIKSPDIAIGFIKGS